jgi:hypothetical protein
LSALNTITAVSQTIGALISTEFASATLLVSGLSSLTNITATNQTVSNLLATSATSAGLLVTG